MCPLLSLRRQCQPAYGRRHFRIQSRLPISGPQLFCNIFEQLQYLLGNANVEASAGVLCISYMEVLCKTATNWASSNLFGSGLSGLRIQRRAAQDQTDAIQNHGAFCQKATADLQHRERKIQFCLLAFLKFQASLHSSLHVSKRDTLVGASTDAEILNIMQPVSPVHALVFYIYFMEPL